ncbi:hypothetical protein DV737_g4809, partial [Chaetothyriales sp. CBS 132003]
MDSIEKAEDRPKSHSSDRDNEELEILDKQLRISDTAVGYTTLYRYATGRDQVIICLCSIVAAGSGVVMPLMTIVFGQFGGTFSALLSDSISISHFNHQVDHFATYYVYLASFFSAILIAFIKSWRLALIMLAVIVAIVLVMGGAGKQMKAFGEKSLESSATGVLMAEEAISSIRIATAFGVQDHISRKYDGQMRETWRMDFRSKAALGLMIAAMMCILNLQYGLAFWQGGVLPGHGDISVSHILTVLFASMMAGVSFGHIAPHLGVFGTAVASARKIFATIDRIPLIDSETDSGDKLDRFSGKVIFDSVRLVYPSRPSVAVFNDFSLTIPSGRTTAIVGPSGCGKSSLVGLIERFYLPVEGKILLDGHDICNLNLRWLRSQMSLAGQDPVLFNTSIYNNIAHGLLKEASKHATRESTDSLVEKAARLANAYDFISGLGCSFGWKLALVCTSTVPVLLACGWAGMQVMAKLEKRMKPKPGEFVALVGASGSGKSTIISLIERFYDPQSGTILVDGQDTSAYNLRQYQSQLALVSQETLLFSGSIRDNMTAGDDTRLTEADISRACECANLQEYIQSLPDGIQTQVGTKGGLLSGGQKQRMAIAKALLRAPKVLALDRAGGGRTTIAISHRLSTIQKADLIYVFDGGRVVEKGRHGELMDKRGMYWELVEMQRLGRNGEGEGEQ